MRKDKKEMERIGRNQLCPCGSGEKYKKCCYGKKIKKILLPNGPDKKLPKGEVVTENPLKEKISEILLEFSGPLTDTCESDRAFYNALQLSVIAWNSSFFSLKERNELIDGDINKHIKDNNNIEITKEILSMMLERKKKNFSHIKMFIVDFEIAYREGQRQLTVMSTPINE